MIEYILITVLAQMTPTPLQIQSKPPAVEIEWKPLVLPAPQIWTGKTCKPFPNGPLKTTKCSDGTWEVIAIDGTVWQGTGAIDPRVLWK